MHLVLAKQLSDRLENVSVSTIYRMAHEGKIPYYLVGKSGMRFNPHEVLEALRSSRQDVKKRLATAGVAK